MIEKIGNTPLIQIRYRYQGKVGLVYSKLEYYNLTGSIKDRIAYYIIRKAKERGELKEGMPIVEATSGNTGIALAAIGAYYKHPVHIFMPDWVSSERVNLMRMYQAEVSLVSKEEGGFQEAIKRAREFAKKENGFLANQFENKDNVLAHYETTGNEILKQIPLEEIGGFISGIGTGGTLMGVAKRLKEANSQIVIAALEPDSMPLLSQNKVIGPHKIEGIGDDFVPDIVKKDRLEEILVIRDEDAINMAKKLARELGIGVGISSGANLLGAILLEEKIGKKVVTVFADDNKKYLSTDLSGDVNLDEKLLSNCVELLDYE